MSDEKLAIAKVLHNTIAQDLAGLAFQIELLKMKANFSAEAVGQIDKLANDLEQTIKKLRQLISNLKNDKLPRV